MHLYTYIPKPPLSRFVNMFWLAENYHPAYAKERILPHGSMEIVIDLDDQPMYLYYPDAPCSPYRFHGPIVAGVRSDFFAVDTTRSGSYLSVWFKPAAALPLFNLPAYELHGLHVPLDVLWHTSAHILYSQLLEARTPLERFHLLEEALLQQLRRGQEQHRAVEFALAAFQTTPQTPPIAHVVERLGISPTRFIQVFKDAVGLTPKVYCRVLRFQETLRAITAQQSTSWADLALNCGYFDQAHFINEFQNFAGISPTRYSPQDPQHQNNLAFG